MYEFYNPNEGVRPPLTELQTIINGVNLDKEIRGFRTLAVYGRELAEKDISYLSEIYLNHDNRFVDTNYKERKITVVYELKQDNVRDFREAYELLNYYLRKPNSQVIFTDDLGFFYVVNFLGGNVEDRNVLSLQSSFKLLAINPFKNAVDLEFLKFRSDGQLRKLTYFPVEIEEIKVSLLAGGNKFILKNTTTGKKLILDKAFSSGESFVINFKKGIILGKNNQSYMKYLDIRSDFEDFTLNYLDKLNTSLTSDVEISFREIRL